MLAEGTSHVVRVEGKPEVGQEVDDAWGRERRVGRRSGQQEWLPQRFGKEGPHCPGKVREREKCRSQIPPLHCEGKERHWSFTRQPQCGARYSLCSVTEVEGLTVTPTGASSCPETVVTRKLDDAVSWRVNTDPIHWFGSLPACLPCCPSTHLSPSLCLGFLSVSLFLSVCPLLLSLSFLEIGPHFVA